MGADREERIASRRMAVQVLYQSVMTGEPAWKIAESPDAVPDAGPLPPYAVKLIEGVAAHEQEINRRLAASSKNWAIERMPLVDRSIMSLAVYEMCYEVDVPISVSINEAVELAHAFGGEDESAKFVNGVLGTIARSLGEVR